MKQAIHQPLTWRDVPILSTPRLCETAARADGLIDWLLRRAGLGRMWVRCSWCEPQRITGFKVCRRAQDGEITDGICHVCRRRFIEDHGLEENTEVKHER